MRKGSNLTPHGTFRLIEATPGGAFSDLRSRFGLFAESLYRRQSSSLRVEPLADEGEKIELIGVGELIIIHDENRRFAWSCDHINLSHDQVERSSISR